MKLSRSPPRAPAETIVALIDVVFFLLVFFMLVGRMDATAPFDVVPPVAGMGAPLPKGGETVALSPDGRLALNGTEMTREAILTELADRSATIVRVQSDGASPLGRLLPLLAALETLEGASVVLIVTPEAP